MITEAFVKPYAFNVTKIYKKWQDERKFSWRSSLSVQNSSQNHLN